MVMKVPLPKKVIFNENLEVREEARKTTDRPACAQALSWVSVLGGDRGREGQGWEAHPTGLCRHHKSLLSR